jgi:hypothetical protein
MSNAAAPGVPSPAFCEHYLRHGDIRWRQVSLHQGWQTGDGKCEDCGGIIPLRYWREEPKRKNRNALSSVGGPNRCAPIWPPPEAWPTAATPAMNDSHPGGTV